MKIFRKERETCGCGPLGEVFPGKGIARPQALGLLGLAWSGRRRESLWLEQRKAGWTEGGDGIGRNGAGSQYRVL